MNSTVLQLAHTADLAPEVLDAAHRLLLDVFGDDFNEHDWEHALGGVHALLREGAELVGHASVVQRRLLHGGRALRTGYVEAVGVRADRRNRGYGARLLNAMEGIVRGGYDLGALAADGGVAGFYMKRGWIRWEGPTAVLSPEGIRRTEEEDGGIYVLPVAAPLDLAAKLVCDWRDGDVW
jgi:aminoglycoside 2'-N-acetyltransferase I